MKALKTTVDPIRPEGYPNVVFGGFGDGDGGKINVSKGGLNVPHPMKIFNRAEFH